MKELYGPILFIYTLWYVVHVYEYFWDSRSHGWMSTCDLFEPKQSYHKWTKLISYRFNHNTMTRGQAVSESIQWTIIRLSAVMPSDDISGFTDISVRKIHDILTHFKETGDVKNSKREKATLHHALQDEDIQVLFIFLLLRYTHLYYIASFQHP